MRRYLNVIAGIFFIVLLTACIGEDYDAGPPEIRLSVNEDVYSLKEANVDWKTEDKEFKNKVENILTLASEQKEIKVSPNQSTELILLESKEDGGDYTDEVIKVSLWKGNEEIELTTKSSTDYSFSFPSDPGEYVLEVDFRTKNGSSQYVGKIILK
ncbi:hypothetical protein [Fictibacillus norfolkensis]|uniref:DUF4625 domain-containing protein n=1 Tax=Fictibacillus norfolkensis TaxID=2762233 RepID=A0ABR8SMR2_9BACL|nr:hypothetical protein [Fictibacillus norfolkensis]MBD7964772.1 hypothetical protein [Fictibacillus norfolkensis]